MTESKPTYKFMVAYDSDVKEKFKNYVDMHLRWLIKQEIKIFIIHQK